MSYVHNTNCRAETAIVQAVDRAEAKPTGPDNPEFCFAAGTLVHTKQGLAPIEQIQVGDWVLSKHESGEGEQAYKRVTRTIKSDKKVPIIYVEYYSERDALPGPFVPNEALRGVFVTESHPFYIKNVGWRPAISVFAPRELIAFDDTPVKVAASYTLWVTPEEGVAVGLGRQHDVGPVVDFKSGIGEIIRNDGDVTDQGGLSSLCCQTVYNLEVEDFRTYYVGELGVWVHNLSCGGAGDAGVLDAPSVDHAA